MDLNGEVFCRYQSNQSGSCSKEPYPSFSHCCINKEGLAQLACFPTQKGSKGGSCHLRNMLLPQPLSCHQKNTHNKYGILGSLTCSQRKEIDRTLTLKKNVHYSRDLQMQHKRRKQEELIFNVPVYESDSDSSTNSTSASMPAWKARLAILMKRPRAIRRSSTAATARPVKKSPPQQVAVHMATASDPSRRITRSMARSMEEAPTYFSLPDERTRRALRQPPSVVTAYMTEDNTVPPATEEQIRTLVTRLDRVEAENQRLHGMLTGARNTAEAGTSQPAPSVPAPVPQSSGLLHLYLLKMYKQMYKHL